MRFGLAKIYESPYYTEYTDYAMSGFVGRVYKAGWGAGQTVCVSPGCGLVQTMLTRIDLLAFPGAEWISNDPQYGRIRWVVNAAGTGWRPINGTALLMSGQSNIGGPLVSIAAGAVAASPPVVIANMLQVGMMLRLRMHVRKKGTAGVGTVNVYFGTAGTTGDSSIYSLPVAATNNRDVKIDTHLTVSGSTQITGIGAALPNFDNSQSAASVSTNINIASAMKITVGYVGAGADSLDLLSYGVYLDAP